MKRSRFNTIHRKLRKEATSDSRVLADPAVFWLALQVVDEMRAKRVLDIGRSGCANLVFWNWQVEPKGLVVGIDENVQTLNLLGAGMRSLGNVVQFFVGDPGDGDVLNHTRRVMAGNPFDFLYLDGEASFSVLRRDFRTFQTLIRPGGKIAVSHLSEPETESFWKDIPYSRKERYDEGVGLGIVSL